MPEYRVRPGRVFGPGRVHKAGDTVVLTEYEAGGFLDILEKIDGTENVVPPVFLSEVQEKLGDKLGDLATLLTDAGFGTVNSLLVAEKGQLLSISGIGPAAYAKIREVLNE